MHIKYLAIQIKTEYHFIFVYCVYSEIYIPFYFYFVFQCLSSIFNLKNMTLHCGQGDFADYYMF